MKTLAWDAETFLIERTRPFPPVVCLSWCDGERGSVIPHGETLRDFVARRLADPEVRLLGHNLAYDHGVLAASYPELLPAIFAAYKSGRCTDTQITQQLIDIAVGRIAADDRVRGYSLAGLYEACFDEPIPGPGKGAGSFRFRYGELYDVDFADWPAEAIDYSREDSIATLRIHDLQEEKASHLLRDDAFQTYSSFVLQLITAQGMRTDPARVAAFKAEQLALCDALRPELIEAGLLVPDFKGRGVEKKQVGWIKKQAPARDRIVATCAEKGIEPLLTDSGEATKRAGKPTDPEKHTSIDRAACVWADDALMLRRADYVSAEKMLNTYVPVLELGYELPITSRYGLAATGRTTSSAPREPLIGTNLQNSPRKPGVRECYVPRAGKVFMLGDFSGAEMHTLAQVCEWRVGYSTLGDTLRAGRDAHLNTARYLLGGASTPLDYGDLALRLLQGDPEVKQARQDSKPVNFGFGGRMGAATFVKTQLKEGKRWTLEEAKTARNAWLAAYPEMQPYFESCKAELGPSGSCVVELYWSKRLRKVRGLSTICNGFFQALTADGAKKAINEVVRMSFCEPESALARSHTYPVNFVHDELINETDDGDVDAMQLVAAEFKQIMEDEFNELIPDYPTSVDVVFARYWSKSIEPVHDSAGRLIPWKGGS
ncbi:hypothetical protein LCGC14_1131540 [marine sediment metagenome]|uniref:DNA-directed DNA polymerase family A palm domain-containing protein n=1 Tax=marine sediment metagenome TaxID=412755 RepID=A0A0F9MNQ8_9ZZZZ